MPESCWLIAFGLHFVYGSQFDVAVTIDNKVIDSATRFFLFV